jgi:tRNA (guanine37-N1)-methyltransferase
MPWTSHGVKWWWTGTQTTDMRRFSVITLFPELLAAFAGVGIVRRACERGIIDIQLFNPRDFATDARNTVDDNAYGGGPGMVMMVPPLRAAIAAARATAPAGVYVVYLSPQGRTLAQSALPLLERHPHLVLLAGRYEGIDERLIEQDIDEEWSLGDFVLSGGEIAAMAVIDALTRRLPGALGDERSALEDSFENGLLDFPHYTRPVVVDGQDVPAVLLSGNHAAIAGWRRAQALERTWRRRPDLLANCVLSASDRALLDKLGSEPQGGSNDAQS